MSAPAVYGSGEEPVELAELPGTPWRVWRDTVLRSTGFPAEGLNLFASASAASAAEARLAGDIDEDAYRAAFGKAASAVGARLYEIAGDPLFREAITWQNPGLLASLDGLRASGPNAPPDRKTRRRQVVVARYWQRYCAKNDSIGFFGPVCWGRLTDDDAVVTARPGPALMTGRQVYFEWWALAAFADRLASDPRFRPHLPVALQPQLSVREGMLHRPVAPATELTRAEAALLSRLSMPRPAAALVAELVADDGNPVRRDADGFMLLERLSERGVLRWGIDLPLNLTAEPILAAAIEAIGDPAAREAAREEFGRLDAARAELAVAAGDSAAVHAATVRLDEVFTELTGLDSRRRAGQTYAGRTLCHEDTDRDLELSFGRPLLAELAPALHVLLTAARWLSHTLASAYRQALREVYAELCADLGTRDVPLGDLRYLAHGLFFGTARRPVDDVVAAFADRWAELTGGTEPAPGTHRVRLRSEELSARAADLFDAPGPGWSTARIHSPDLQIVAPSVKKLAAGDYTVVLGELHAAYLTLCTGVFSRAHPRPGALRAAIDRDLGTNRVQLLLPDDFPRMTARVADLLWSPDNWQLGFVPAPGAEHSRLLPVTALTVTERDGDLVARHTDGQEWPLLEVFADFLSMHTADAFKLVAAGAHTPRVTIDRLVVERETWRCTVGSTGLATAKGYAQRYLAARRWAAELGLPDRVFIRLGTELKPTYADLTSPPLVLSLVSMMRGAWLDGGADVEVVVTEALPLPEDTWVPDAAGRTYYSELRMQILDPLVPPHTKGGTDD
ncbi:lantibiotic dehydratase [Streptomyces camponoticapitis]|uniref:Lantibiotic dehydratase n=1 Tax=Streptomyces camponoticapitis TaxID=1616125 RepID=A0ABQ2ELS6_9ACTN|nr:lantibiotic dehydratase [Streptomyces camponoticapitis]